MPGTNLTREEAQTRAGVISVDSYDVELDLTTGDTPSARAPGDTASASTTTIRFTARPGASTFADLVDATVHEVTLNGKPIDPSTAYADSRIRLDDPQADKQPV